MKLATFYKKVVAIGTKNDPRGRGAVKGQLERARLKFRKLDGDEKEFFDQESLVNPYSDTRILHGVPSREVRSLLVGIDIDAGELAVAERLRERGTSLDLVLAHHPSGPALARLYEVMKMQIDIVARLGVPISMAEDLMEGRIKQIERRLLPANHNRAADAARLLDIPLMCAHTPADNMVTGFLSRMFEKEEPQLLSEVVDLLLTLPEYRTAAAQGLKPKIVCGSKERRCGKIFVDMTGGTSGAKKMFRGLARSGVSTIVGMHISDEYREEAKKRHLNVIIAGHISSDTLGMNLLLDEVFRGRKRPPEVIECSGFRRIPRENPHHRD